jgi:branched-subunit amino acid aminotransferase/4-amino-4-deoxychorismate lyase
VVLDCARELGIPANERPLHIDEAKAAREVFITSTTRQIVPVFKWTTRSSAADGAGR